MALIEVDYHDALRKADRLDELARELRNIAAQDLQNIQSGASRSWKGSASELYQKRLRTHKQQVEAHAKDCQSLANSLRKAAKRYQQLEMLANSIFGG